MATLEDFCEGLLSAGVRFVVIGVSGANFYASSKLFMTHDDDLLLPPDQGNLLTAWRVAEQQGLELWSGDEPLDQPRDEFLARAVVQRRAVTSVSDGAALQVDLTLTMTGFDFETVYSAHREFRLGNARIPVARLSHIVQSKVQAGRPKDRLFLATHAEALRRLLAGDEQP